MKAVLVAILFALMFIPLSPAFSQVTDSGSGLSVITTSDAPYIYKNEEGKTVVVGEIENRNSLTSMSGIIVRAIFYNESAEEIIEIVRAETILDIVPPESTSPYVITSQSSNPAITHVTVDVEAFNSSPNKPVGLELNSIDISNNESLMITGTVKNTGNVPSKDALVHMVFYDVFSPPRILHVETFSAGNLPLDAVTDFNFSGIVDPKSVGVRIFAESDVLHSDTLDVKIPPREILTSLVKISGLTITNSEGSTISNIPVNSSVDIGSSLMFETIANDRVQPYVYYVQIKQSGETPFVEFLSSVDGNFYGNQNEDVSVKWTPTTPGLYFVETFAWDQNFIPISSKGPVSIILVS